MQKYFKPVLAVCAFAAFVVGMSFTRTEISNKKIINPATSNSDPKIQVAILLDVSNSMDGLIAQAKAQLWNMVTVLGKATNNQKTPNIEIALYEYGRTNNDPKNGYVKQINGFISNLDSLSENLFKLSTNGGDEYCGTVIYKAIDELKWDEQGNNYKVIFIAGNEDFLQGSIKYTEACRKAKAKGVTVNTIYCGTKDDGIKEHWNLGNECSNGSFTNINPNSSIEEIDTPYDSTITALNKSLNGTYVTYGWAGSSNAQKQVAMDYENARMSKSAGIKRATAKASKAAYRNDDWDLVDAYAKDSTIVNRLDRKTLADSLRNKKPEEIKAIINQQTIARNNTQSEIAELSRKRAAYIVEENKKRAKPTDNNLENEVERIIKAQAQKYNFKFE